MNKIEDFKQLHNEKHCFIICSGPSLSELDLSPLRRRLTFGLNRSFKVYEGAYYHCVMDGRLFDLYPDELKNTRYLFTLEDRPWGIPIGLIGANGFSWDLTKGIYSGYTVSFFALQIAVYMGFTKIIYLGLDLHNTTEKTHFFGKDYHSRDHDTTEYPKMIASFNNVADELKGKGIKVYNCSKESRLKCFEYLSYEEALKI